MMDNNFSKKSLSLTDHLSVLLRWSRFFLINFIIVISIVTVVVFLIKEDFKATAVFMLPEDNSSGLGGLSGLIGGKSSALSMGAKFLGISAASEDVILGLLNSRTAQMKVIEKFGLRNYYEINDNEDKLLKAFRGDVSFDPNEFGMLEISVIHKSPDTAAIISNYFVDLVDSMNIRINSEQAKNNRLFIENRYNKNIEDLKAAEDSMYAFQKKYGVFAVPEQLEVSVKAAAELESELTAKEIAAHFAELQYGKNSPQQKIVSEEVKILKDKVLELKNADKLSSSSNILFPFKQIPIMTLQYYRYYREIEIQSAIMEIIMPMYEQAKVEEQKSIPTIVKIDEAVPPQLKNSPKRMFIISGIGFLFALLLILIIYIGDRILHDEQYSNPLKQSLSKSFNLIARIYKVRLN